MVPVDCFVGGIVPPDSNAVLTMDFRSLYEVTYKFMGQ